MKNVNLTLLDPNQIIVNQHDHTHDAQRVIVVGTDIAESIKESLKDFKIEVKQPEVIQSPMQVIEIPKIIIEYKEIEKPIFVTEYQIIQVPQPVIVKEIQIIEIEKPITVKEIQVIEKPVIIKEIEKFPKLIIGLLFIQVLVNLISIFFHK